MTKLHLSYCPYCEKETMTQTWFSGTFLEEEGYWYEGCTQCYGEK